MLEERSLLTAEDTLHIGQGDINLSTMKLGGGGKISVQAFESKYFQNIQNLV